MGGFKSALRRSPVTRSRCPAQFLVDRFWPVASPRLRDLPTIGVLLLSTVALYTTLKPLALARGPPSGMASLTPLRVLACRRSSLTCWLSLTSLSLLASAISLGTGLTALVPIGVPFSRCPGMASLGLPSSRVPQSTSPAWLRPDSTTWIRIFGPQELPISLLFVPMLRSVPVSLIFALVLRVTGSACFPLGRTAVPFGLPPLPLKFCLARAATAVLRLPPTLLIFLLLLPLAILLAALIPRLLLMCPRPPPSFLTECLNTSRGQLPFVALSPSVASLMAG